MEKSPSAVFQALLSEDDGPETGIPGRPTEVIRAAISAGDQYVVSYGCYLPICFALSPVLPHPEGATSYSVRAGTEREPI